MDTNIKQLPAFKVEGVPWMHLRNNWIEYKKEFVYIVKSMTRNQKKKVKTIFLNMAGREVQRIVETLLNQNLETEMFDDGLESKDEIEDYRKMMELLDEYFQPKHHEILQRYEFASLQPNANEPMDKFLLRMKTAVTSCNFGKTELESRQIAVMDKIVQYAPQDLKQKILRKDWTLEELSQFVSSYVKTKEECDQFNETQTKFNNSASNPSSSSSLTESVAKIQPLKRARTWNKPRTPANECSRCGFDHAKDAYCPAAKVVCAHCKKIGHYARKCFSKDQENPDSQQKHPLRSVSDSHKRSNNSKEENVHKKHKIAFVQNNEELIEEEITHITVSTIRDFDDALMPMSIGGVFTYMLVDSGCKHNLVTSKTLEYLRKNDAELGKFSTADVTMSAYGQSSALKIKTKFEANLKVSSKGVGTKATFYVVPEGTQNLLGRDTAMKIGVLKIGLPVDEQIVSKIEVKCPEFPYIQGRENI